MLKMKQIRQKKRLTSVFIIGTPAFAKYIKTSNATKVTILLILFIRPSTALIDDTFTIHKIGNVKYDTNNNDKYSQAVD